MNKTTDNEYYQAAADHLYNQNEREKSVLKYKRAILTCPDKSRAYYDLGFILSQEKRYNEAIRNFKKAALIQPYSSRVYRSWGVALYWLGNYQEAELKLEEARRIYNACTETDYWLGEVLLKFNQYDEVIAICERVERMDHNNLKIYRPWIAAMLDLGKIKEAKSLLGNLKRKNPQSHRTYFYIGIVFEYKGMYEEAIECYEKAYEISANFDCALNNWGCVLVSLGNYEGALGKFNKVLDMNKEEFRTYLNLSIVYYLQNKLIDAYQIFEKGLDIQTGVKSFDKSTFITETEEEIQRVNERLSSESEVSEPEKIKIKALEFILDLLKNGGLEESKRKEKKETEESEVELLDTVASC